MYSYTQGAILKHATLAFLFVLLFTFSIRAALSAEIAAPRQWAQMRLESIGAAEIPRAVVATLAQDRTGFIWLATGDGLVRYDGYRFKPIEATDSDPIQRNLGWIRALFAGNDGRMWIGTESRGLAVYDPIKDTVQIVGNVHLSSTPDRSAAHSAIRALAQDQDGSIWIGSTGAGLSRYDTKHHSFTSFQGASLAGTLPDNQVESLLVDRQGDLWVGTWAGLSRKRANTEKFERWVAKDPHNHRSLEGSSIQALMEGADGRIWVGTRQGGVALIDPNNESTEFFAATGKAGGASAGAVSSFAKSPDETVWVGRSTGIEIRDSRNGTLLKTVTHEPVNGQGLAANEVTGLLRGNDGWIWISGFGVGLQRHDPNNVNMKTLRTAFTSSRTSFQLDVRRVLQLDNGDIWVATHTNGIALLGPNLQAKGAVALFSQHAKHLGARTGAMTQSDDGTVWIESDGQLLQFNRNGKLQGKLAFSAGTIHRLIAGANGRVWICAQGGLYQAKSGDTQAHLIPVKGGGRLEGDAFTVTQAPDQSTWVGTSKGLFRIETDELTLTSMLSPAKEGLGTPVVIGLLWDHNGTLWVDTAISGLHKLKEWGNGIAKFDRISERHGIVSRPFGANLMEDAKGRIWSQLHVYDPASDRLDALTSVDGVDIGTPWFFSFTKLHDGRMLFGGSKGLLIVSPEAFVPSNFAPPVVLTQLRLNNVAAPSPARMNQLRLAPDQKSFSMEFAALDLTEPSRLRYAYKLEGHDTEWIKTGADLRTANYGNLSPGTYVLHVRATNRHGVWSTQELTIPVEVVPTWWQTWTFKIIAFVATLLLLYAVLQTRTYQLKLRQINLERKVQERTIALEQASLTDPLTGMRNRRFLSRHIDADINLAVRKYAGFGRHGTERPTDADLIFFLIDLDHFKDVNDQLGHAAGDAILMQLKERFSTVFRDTDYMVRWGGEEFLMVARATDRSFAMELAERVRHAVSATPFRLDDGSQISKTCSVGYSCFPLSPTHPALLDWSTTINVADTALYDAKTKGRNAYVGILDTGDLAESQILSAIAVGNFCDSGSFTVQRSAAA
jgi:diguanylate cyclase (GGDEF)-like protein